MALTWGVEGDFNHEHTSMGDKLGRLVWSRWPKQSTPTRAALCT